MWTPQIKDSAAPLYVRLADALAADVDAGVLLEGTKLPPHRDLAYRLSIGIGTVTKAYEEAERRGLIVAQVGRGSFVAPRPEPMHQRDHGALDLAMNIVPAGPMLARLPEAMNALRHDPGLADRFGYAPSLGHDADRKAGLAWLARVNALRGGTWQRTICTLGAQHAMTLLFSVIARRGDVILTENVNYLGVKALAAHDGYRLRGVAMDGQGLCPDALEKAARATGARLLYTVPTLHNPTARIMSAERREAIVAVARKLDLTIVEDDIYAHFARGLDVEPLVNLAPERTCLIGGLSKAIAPGLRAGYLAVPDEPLVEKLMHAARATVFAPPGLSFALATQLIDSGMAEAIVGEVCDEIEARTLLAAKVLTGIANPPACPASLHLWLPMAELDAERVTGRAMRAGLSLLAPGTGAISDDAETGLRVSLGAIGSRALLSDALDRLRGALAGDLPVSARGMI